MDFPATERTQQFYGHGDPAREAVAGKYSSSSFYEESHSSTPGAQVGEGDCSRQSGCEARWGCDDHILALVLTRFDTLFCEWAENAGRLDLVHNSKDKIGVKEKVSKIAIPLHALKRIQKRVHVYMCGRLVA